jgi:hypothetical protein
MAKKNIIDLDKYQYKAQCAFYSNSNDIQVNAFLKYS